ncbi:sister chromatid cohesion protein Dcc1 [Crucibulum laeve]|uniref:Sister chromatid cohesion protein Dcc1 n=1 Tax=Crucibulum laeve TaxID=68775 RepID=A0A5C3MEX2_9AGAR|nr:sister chromatid cohesion protein Dcc1 [Crucibulum laeve]
MPEYDLSFSSSSSTDGGSYKLMELPPELTKLIEDALANGNHYPPTFTVKGDPLEDAVLCTTDKTYSMRSVNLSNSILMVTPPVNTSSNSGENDMVVIRDQVNEIIELAPTVPKLHKLSSLLRGREYDDTGEDVNSASSSKRFTYEDARAEIQASDVELDCGLKDRRILNVNGELRPITPSYLNSLLELLLNLLVSLSLPHDAAPVEDISSVLADEHEVSRAVSTQVMSWFGEIYEGKWSMDVQAAMKEVGLGILRNHKHEPIEKQELLAKWKSFVGDTFESSISLDLLLGNFLVSTSQMGEEEMLTYFAASSLPVEPAARFGDLFLTRTRWKGEDIEQFLADIAVNNKERDKLLLKYCRATTDATGVWYTARAQYNG